MRKAGVKGSGNKQEKGTGHGEDIEGEKGKSKKLGKRGKEVRE